MKVTACGVLSMAKLFERVVKCLLLLNREFSNRRTKRFVQKR